MEPDNATFAYDVFISYSHRDAEWVRGWLLPRLRRAGLRVCIDYDCFDLGEPIVTGLQLANTAMILSGAIPAALLALLVDGGLGWVEGRLRPAGLEARK